MHATRESLALINTLLRTEEPERHVFDVQMLLAELFAGARDEAEERAVKEFASATLAYLRGGGRRRPSQTTEASLRELNDQSLALSAILDFGPGPSEEQN